MCRLIFSLFIHLYREYIKKKKKVNAFQCDLAKKSLIEKLIKNIIWYKNRYLIFLNRIIYKNIDIFKRGQYNLVKHPYQGDRIKGGIIMHEGKHGILDGVDDIDDIFGTKPKKKGKHDHDHDDNVDHDHDHNEDHDHDHEDDEKAKHHGHGCGCNC